MTSSNTDEPRGLIMVLTGHGKGKTTAAIGLTVRAAAAKILAEFPHETDDHFLRAALPGESSTEVRQELLGRLEATTVELVVGSERLQARALRVDSVIPERIV